MTGCESGSAGLFGISFLLGFFFSCLGITPLTFFLEALRAKFLIVLKADFLGDVCGGDTCGGDAVGGGADDGLSGTSYSSCSCCKTGTVEENTHLC